MYYFKVSLFNTWNPRDVKISSDVNLLSLKYILGKFPKIENKFFEDLKENIKKKPNYFSQDSIKRVVGPEKEEYDISNWFFLWGFDFKKRGYQLLIQIDKEGKGILAAIGPMELASFFDRMKLNSILPTLSLINSTDKMKFVVFLKPRGDLIIKGLEMKGIEKGKIQQIMDYWKTLKNVDGQWFPTFKPRCPRCGRLIEGLHGFEIGFIPLICPKCGYEIKKKS